MRKNDQSTQWQQRNDLRWWIVVFVIITKEHLLISSRTYTSRDFLRG